jgi:hypothetical protein
MDFSESVKRLEMAILGECKKLRQISTNNAIQICYNKFRNEYPNKNAIEKSLNFSFINFIKFLIRNNI